MQLVVGTLLLLFGLRWLRKAILRAAGVLALHDEAKAFEAETEALRRQGVAGGHAIDTLAFMASFNIVMLEGIEAVFIVIAIGASGRMMLPASVGAVMALLVVVALGLWLHRPLARVPENTLKLGVGVMLSAFGTFWVGEGAGWNGRRGLGAAGADCRLPRSGADAGGDVYTPARHGAPCDEASPAHRRYAQAGHPRRDWRRASRPVHRQCLAGRRHRRLGPPGVVLRGPAAASAAGRCLAVHRRAAVVLAASAVRRAKH